MHDDDRYGDLLALAEDLEDIRSTRVLRAVPSRRASQVASARLGTGTNSGAPGGGGGSSSGGGGSRAKKMLIDDSDSSEESTDVRLDLVSTNQTKAEHSFAG